MRRRNIDPELKMAVVIEGLRGETSISELCRKYQISETIYYKWRDKFMEGARLAEAFDQAHRSLLKSFLGYYNAAHTLLRNTLELNYASTKIVEV